MNETLRNILETTGSLIEAAGVAVVVIGIVGASGTFFFCLRREPLEAYRVYRANVARSVILGLEFLVAGDIIRTVVVDPDLANIGALALIVLIRTFLSLTLEMEVSGRWPWHRAEPHPERQV